MARVPRSPSNQAARQVGRPKRSQGSALQNKTFATISPRCVRAAARLCDESNPQSDFTRNPPSYSCATCPKANTLAGMNSGPNQPMRCGLKTFGESCADVSRTRHPNRRIFDAERSGLIFSKMNVSRSAPPWLGPGLRRISQFRFSSSAFVRLHGQLRHIECVKKSSEYRLFTPIKTLNKPAKPELLIFRNSKTGTPSSAQ